MDRAKGTHKSIIDTYNNHKPLARSYKVRYTDAYCAATISAAAIVCELTDIIPLECGCGQQIELFKKANRWVENDAHTPKIGDIIYYDWDDDGVGDNEGWPEHVGAVVEINGDDMVVTEGNIGGKVGQRKMKVNGKFIRGYGVPNYASKVSESASTETPGEPEPPKLNTVPLWVGSVTATILNVRTWAGQEYPNLKTWPRLAKNNLIDICDNIKAGDGSDWYYVRIDGRIFGFVSAKYIKKV